MVGVLDVARYILDRKGPMTAMKLQKLCYYARAWSLVWDEKPLFKDRIEAWSNGPVCPVLYDAHRGLFEISAEQIQGDPSKLSDEEKKTVDAVLKHYGDRSSQWLSELTHQESPWKDARVGMSAADRGNTEITDAAMMEYYESLLD